MTYEQLCETLKAHAGEKLAIELQQVPDPDAMSSAKVVYDAAVAHGLQPSITHAYQLSHKSNIILARRLGLPMTLHQNSDVSKFDSSFYVDHSGSTSPWALSGKLAKPIGIIDHHDLGREVEAEYLDRRPVGATASILTEYLKEGGMDALYSTDEERGAVAAGLSYGIKTDTAGFAQNFTPTDKKAMKYLERFTNAQILAEIESPKWSKEWFDDYGKAIGNRRTEHGTTLADVGKIEGKDRDVLAMIAESLLGEQSVDTTIVYGLHDYIDVSIRTTNPTFDYDALSDTFSGNGGGKEGSAGVQIPLEQGFVSVKPGLESTIREEFEERIFGEKK